MLLVSQKVHPQEIIVIDDASTDDSVAVIERLVRREPLVRLVKNERNMGVVATVNRGLALAQGEFFYGASADDLVAPILFESIERMIDRFPRAGIYFGMYRAIDALDREICVEKPARWHDEMYATPEVFLNEYLESEPPSHSLGAATVYRKSCIDEVGGFRKELGHWSDTFVVRAIGLKYGAAYTPQVLVSMRRLRESFSQTQARDFRLMLDVTARAAWLMRSPELRDRFPEAHVARWEKVNREYIILDHLKSTHRSVVSTVINPPPELPGGNIGRKALIEWPKRFWARLVFAYHWRRLQAYVPDVSCYSGC